MSAAADKGLSAAMLDRLQLDASRVAGIANGLDAIADLPDPVGAVEKSLDTAQWLGFQPSPRADWRHRHDL